MQVDTAQNSKFMCLDGARGTKVDELHRNSDLLRSVGFVIPKTATLGMEWADRVARKWKELGAPKGPDIGAVVNQLTFHDLAIPGVALRALGNPGFLAVRSDAYGDSSGMGLYHSQLIRRPEGNFEAATEHSFWQACFGVLASHESRAAVNFRRENGLPDGIALCLQAVVGDQFPSNDGEPLFGPLLTGIMQPERQAIGQHGIVVEFGFMDAVSAKGKYVVDASGQGFCPATAKHIEQAPTTTLMGFDSGKRLDSVSVHSLPFFDQLCRSFESIIAEKLLSMSCKLVTDHPNAYVEFAVNCDLEVVALQYSDTSLPHCDMPTVDDEWITARSILQDPNHARRYAPVGQVLGYDKPLIDLRRSDALWKPSESRAPRSCVLVCPPAALAEALLNPSHLWDQYYAATCLVVPVSASAVTFGTLASHVSGAVRRASFSKENSVQFAILFIPDAELTRYVDGATFATDGTCLSHTADVAVSERDRIGAMRLRSIK